MLEKLAFLSILHILKVLLYGEFRIAGYKTWDAGE